MLFGWAAVDGLVERAQRSLVAPVCAILGVPQSELEALEQLISSDRPLYVSQDDADLSARAIGALLERAREKPWPTVMFGLRALIPVNGLFTRQAPRADTQPDIAGDPELAARLFAEVVMAVNGARSRLTARVLAALKQFESETHRLIASVLHDARAVICRETLRYFALSDESSVDTALKLLHELPTKTDGSPKGPTPKVTHADELQAALRMLVPYAEQVLTLEAQLWGTTPTPRRMVETELDHKRMTYAHELGRHAQDFPVLSQIAAEDITPASAAGPVSLGGYVFAVLRRAYQANLSMATRVESFVTVSALADVRADRHPQQAAVREIRRVGTSKTVWGYRKYLERALTRTAGSADDFTRRAVEDVTAGLDVGEGSVTADLAQAAGEIVALELTSRLVPRFVPALNVLLAAWHMSVAAQKFRAERDEFYCSLDPRDALIEAAPSVRGLVLEIAAEAAFVFI